nr:NepR family anti-sigma factor [Altererythrobacter segetis]
MPKDGAKPRDPEWTAGLKRLYDSVVDEPLPDAFTELLNKLDAAD